jgi:hypothetical protein
MWVVYSILRPLHTREKDSEHLLYRRLGDAQSQSGQFSGQENSLSQWEMNEYEHEVSTEW